jgi:large subunit ribosomal protein L21
MFAIISIKNKQYVAHTDEVLSVDRLEGEVGDSVAVDGVLLYADGKTTTVGAPFVKGMTVKAEIVKNYKGEKISVRRYKQKVRYRKANGFRPYLTDVKIVSIG